MRQKLLPIYLFTILWSTQIFAQKTLEVGGFIGISNYLGDLQQTKFERNENNIALGFFTRLNLTKKVSLKFSFNKGEISGRDSNYRNLESVRNRNLSFRSHIFEFALTNEITFVSFGDNEKRIAAPFIFLGISGFYFNPQAVYDGRWIDLQPLGTEGQTLPNSGMSKYKLFQIGIPFGIGFNINVGKNANIGFEVGLRKTFTDYLDDISSNYPDMEALQNQNPTAAKLSFRMPEITGNYHGNPAGELRGSSDKKDLYFMGGITFSAYVEEWFAGKNKFKKRKK